MPRVDTDYVEDVRNRPQPRRGGRLRLFLLIFVILLIIVALSVGGLFFFGILPIESEPTATPDVEPTQIRTIADFNACAPALAAFPGRFCYDEQIETDATWSNSTILSDERVTEDMAFSAVFVPGTRWIVADNPEQALEKVFYLPEGDTVEYTRFHLNLAATHPLATIMLNGEEFIQGENFDYPVDTIPSGLGILLSRPNEDAASDALTQLVNVPGLLRPGRNVIQFQFAEADAIIDPESTPEPDAEPVVPLYALLAEIRVPTTAEYNTVVTAEVLTDEQWLDAPYAGFLPDSDPDTLDGAHWVQGEDVSSGEPVTIEQVFYVVENAPGYSLDIDVQEGVLQEIIITNADGEATALSDNRIPEGRIVQETSPSFQRYEDIPFAGATSPGLNRLSIVYAPNSDSAHYVRASLNHTEGLVAITDDSWLRAGYSITPEITDNLILSSQVARGNTRLRAFVAIPGIADDDTVSGQVSVGCIFVDVLCENVRLAYGDNILRFDDTNPIVIAQPDRLFSFDLVFLSDNLTVERAQIGLQIQYDDGSDETISLNAASAWYGYRPVEIVESPPNSWARIDDSAYMRSTTDNREGQYISVFERQLFLPENAVVTSSQFNLSVDDNILAVYINGEAAYVPADPFSRATFREVNQIPLDGALLRGGDNRIVIYSFNGRGNHGTSFGGTISYFTLESPVGG